MSELDEQFMKRALDLARRGRGQVSPNPAVGAVVVRDRAVVGEGFFLYEHLKHAEVYALEQAGELARGATLYCSLEQLRNAGITVEVGLLEEESRRINEAFFKFAQESSPFIHTVEVEAIEP